MLFFNLINFNFFNFKIATFLIFLFVQGMVMKRGGKEEKNNNKPLVTLHEEGSEERIKVGNISETP